MKRTLEAESRYTEMCMQIGDVVLIMAEAGHETKKVAIADVMRTRLAGAINDGATKDELWAMEEAIRLLER